MRDNRDQSLDVIRGVAIILAMGWHLNSASITPVLDWILEPGRRFGWAGVDLFFVLSGFLIGGLVIKELDGARKFNTGRFLFRRALRLWPVVWFYLAAQLITGDKPWQSFLFQNLLHIQNYWTSSLKHLWSLAVEEHFYLAMAMLLTLAAHKHRDSRFLAPFLVAAILIAPALRLTGVILGVDAGAIQIQTQYRIDALAVGVLLAYLKARHPSEFDALQGRPALHATIISAGAIYLFFSDKRSHFHEIIGYSITALTSASFLLTTYKSNIIKNHPAAFSAISRIGLYSYSMYIWHLAAARIAVRILEKFDINSATATTIFKYALAIALAAITYYLIEKPAMSLRDRISNSRAPPPSEQPQPSAPKNIHHKL